MIKAAGFDVGHTLISYKNPLNWQSLYIPALEIAVKSCGISADAKGIEAASEILSKYNTRLNYREHEVRSDVIFAEIFDKWKAPLSLMPRAKEAFFSFFQADAQPYPDALPALKKLRQMGVKTGALTDVAYGMDNEFSLKDIEPLRDFLDAVLTSVDVGWRKPNAAGFIMLAERLNADPAEIIYIGDEEKDVLGAKNAGMRSILITRNDSACDFSQDFTVRSLEEIPALILAAR